MKITQIIFALVAISSTDAKTDREAMLCVKNCLQKNADCIEKAGKDERAVNKCIKERESCMSKCK